METRHYCRKAKEEISIMVYVLAQDGKPLMPTERHGKVKHLLRDGKAKVVRREPFTIQLLYNSGTRIQSITLGVDAGYQHIGLSASTESKEVFAGEVLLRKDIVDNLATRRQFRHARRNRKTRYRQARFLNRAKPKGWLAPSVGQRINSHLSVVKLLHSILPIDHIVVEVAQFDIQKIKNPNIQGDQYQQGEQLGFWNVREYVLARDNHTCQHCKGKSKDLVLNVHHLESRKTGGDAPNNLITLCETCHKAYHSGTITLSIKRGTALRNAAFMNIARWEIYNGYITKNTRIRNTVEKTHAADALCIAGHPTAHRTTDFCICKFVRSRNRQLHKATINKGGYRKANQAPKYVFGYQLFDAVRMPDGKAGFVFGRRLSGSFDLRTLDGQKLSAGISCKKLMPLQKRKNLLIERRVSAVSSAT